MSIVDPRIPLPIHDLWATLQPEVVWLHGRWIIYRQLYGTSPERIDILNHSAPTFFNVVQENLLREVQLSLSKLGDPAGSGTRTNLTLEALVEQLAKAGEVAVVAKLRPLVATFDSACARLRHRRNKWIAHFDLKTMIDSKVSPLEGPSRLEIEAALAALRDAMNCVELFYTGSQMAYEHFLMNNDGEHLLSVLKQGLRYRQLVIEGVVPHDDLRKNFKPNA